MPKDESVLMEGVTLALRNFSGKGDTYNPEGKRNFAVLLDEDTAVAMEADGWPVKRFKPREDAEDDTRQAFLKVTVNYAVRPPKVVIVTSTKRRQLKEDEVYELDNAEITNVDMYVRPYFWEARGETGVSAYLQSMYVTIEEDYLERKYADLEPV